LSTPVEVIVSTIPADEIVSITPVEAIVSITPADEIVSITPVEAIVSITPADEIVSIKLSRILQSRGGLSPPSSISSPG